MTSSSRAKMRTAHASCNIISEYFVSEQRSGASGANLVYAVRTPALLWPPILDEFMPATSWGGFQANNDVKGKAGKIKVVHFRCGGPE